MYWFKSFFKQKSTKLWKLGSHFERRTAVDCAVLSIARAKWSSWPLSGEATKQIDQLQSHMYALCTRPKWSLEDTPETIRAQRFKLAKKMIKVKWSTLWFQSARQLYDHCCRAHVAGEAANFLLRVCDVKVLRERRDMNLRLCGMARPGTRIDR